MVNAGSESSSKKSILHHLTQYTGLDFYQVLNLHGTINCKKILPDYATSESGSDWVQVFVFPMICAWLPLFGFLPCTNAGWALQPGLTQSLRICKERRHPPHHLQATKVLSNPTVFLNFLTPSTVTATFAKGRACTQLTWKGCAVSIWALRWRLFRVHISSVLPQKCFKTAFQNTWWHLPK